MRLKNAATRNNERNASSRDSHRPGNVAGCSRPGHGRLADIPVARRVPRFRPARDPGDDRASLLQRRANARRGRRLGESRFVNAALFVEHFAQLLEFFFALPEVLDEVIEEVGRRFGHRLREHLQRHRARLLEPACPLLRVRFRVQFVGRPVVRRGKLTDARRRRDRNLGDRSRQQPLPLVAVETGQRRDAGEDPVVLVRQRVEMVPEPLDQLSGQTEPIPQARIAVLPRPTPRSAPPPIPGPWTVRQSPGAPIRGSAASWPAPPEEPPSSSSKTRRRSASRASDRAARIRR